MVEGVPHAPERTFRRLVWTLAVASGATVANLYYNQPLLAEIARSFSASLHAVGLVPTLTQVGYGLGMLFVVPLGDARERRSLVVACIGAVSVTLVAIALSPNLPWLLAASLAMGIATCVPQILVPLAANLAPPGERGRALAAPLPASPALAWRPGEERARAPAACGPGRAHVRGVQRLLGDARAALSDAPRALRPAHGGSVRSGRPGRGPRCPARRQTRRGTRRPAHQRHRHRRHPGELCGAVVVRRFALGPRSRVHPARLRRASEPHLQPDAHLRAARRSPEPVEHRLYGDVLHGRRPGRLRRGAGVLYGRLERCLRRRRGLRGCSAGDPGRRSAPASTGSGGSGRGALRRNRPAPAS